MTLHEFQVTSVDALTRERAISSGGRDNSIRVWKIVEESQLVYNGHYNGSIDAVKLINEENFLSAGDDGVISTWNVNRKKPLFSVKNAHGSEKTPDGLGENPRWISAIAAWTNTDLVASGSSDGFIRLWKCGERFKSLTEVSQIPCPGWINSIQFSHGNELNGKFLVVGIGKEHKLGRWFENIKEAKNSIVIIPLCSKLVAMSLANTNTDTESSAATVSTNGIGNSELSTTLEENQEDENGEDEDECEEGDVELN
jgi:ribosomal RNA-processing protein 9